MCESRMLKIIIDFMLVMAPYLLVKFMDNFIQPVQNGFFCNDESIMYPYVKQDRAPWDVVEFIGCLLAVVLIIGVETILKKYNACYDDEWQSFKLFGVEMTPYIQNIYHYIGLFTFSFWGTQFLTDGTKLIAGKLRPYFMDICRPILENGTSCSDPTNWNKYITEYTCSNSDEHAIRESRLSFPSGHTSFSFSVAFYCIFYLETRMRNRNCSVIKHFIHLTFIALALYVSISRIADHRHHYVDIAGGMAFGIGISYMIFFYMANAFKGTKEVKIKQQV